MQWLIDLFVALWQAIFGKPDRVSIKGRVCMPLCYIRVDGRMGMTWDYLNKASGDQEQMRWHQKQIAQDDETPACAFLLSPPQEAGMIFDPWPTVNEANLTAARDAIKALVDDGIAVFACLYTDDKAPWWCDIRANMDPWRRVNEVIGPHVNGYLLSIESNEQARSIGQLQDCIAAMEEAMPGADYYGTHLQWNKKSNLGGYRWLGGASTPFNASLILAECSWNPSAGDKQNFEAMKKEVQAIIANETVAKLCIHEYNLNPAGAVIAAQRTMLRELSPWGVG